MSSLILNKVWKVYDGDIVAVRDASFEAREGEFLALLGPSGCGKSSTMRMIAGLEAISKGQIRFGNDIINDWTPAQRNVALAFESYALYSPLTVRENLEFPLRSRHVSPADIKKRVASVVKTFRIGDLLDRKPSSLSGGQAQRVSIARALVREPNIMLLDEPLSHLDYRLRSELRVKIRHIHDELGATTIYVTHDQEEAIALSDRIIVMNHAEIQQIGAVESLWSHPVNKFVAGFLGDPAMNFIRVEYHDGKFTARAGCFDGPRPPQKTSASELMLGFRPENTAVRPAADTLNGLLGEISVNEFHGERCVLTIETDSGQFKAIDGCDSPWRPGDKVRLVADPKLSHLFSIETGASLLDADRGAQ